MNKLKKTLVILFQRVLVPITFLYIGGIISIVVDSSDNDLSVWNTAFTMISAYSVTMFIGQIFKKIKLKRAILIDLLVLTMSIGISWYIVVVT
jgi:hypothetical protein